MQALRERMISHHTPEIAGVVAFNEYQRRRKTNYLQFMSSSRTKCVFRQW
jgi:hypothetical protein